MSLVASTPPAPSALSDAQRKHILPLFRCPRLCRLCMLPVESQWWETVHGRPTVDGDTCSRGFMGHAEGFDVVHVVCAEQQPTAADVMLKGHGRPATKSAPATATQQPPSLIPARGQATRMPQPIFTSSSTSSAHNVKQYPQQLFGGTQPAMRPVVRYSSTVGSPGSRYGPYPHRPSPAASASYPHQPKSQQQQPQPQPQTEPFPGFDACRLKNMSLDGMLQQYPQVRAEDLLRTGMTVKDIGQMYRSGGDHLVRLLSQRGLTYGHLKQHGRTRTLWGGTKELDAASLGFGRSDWQWLGVQQPSDIGLSMAQWNQLGA